MKMRKAVVTSALVVVTAAFSVSAFAEPSWRKIGTLDCSMGPSIGLVYGDRQQARCIFSDLTGAKQNYIGRASRPGLNKGIASGSKLIWSVLAKSSSSPKTLTGSYNGRCSEMSASARTLSGPEQSLCLQPPPAGMQRRPNLALQITKLSLE